MIVDISLVASHPSLSVTKDFKVAQANQNELEDDQAKVDRTIAREMSRACSSLCEAILSSS